MSFNWRLLPLILGLLAAPVGCAKLGFGEKIPPAEPLRVKAGETACLREAGQVIEDYVAARAGPEALRAMFDCVDGSIQLFLDRTRTNTPGVYQPIELRNFIEKFFIGDKLISNALMAETMEFKRSILGGRGDTLTTEELRSARRIMASLSELLLSLERFRPLTISSLAALPVPRQNEVLQRISEVSESFGYELAAMAGDYSMARFEALLQEFERTFPSDALKTVLKRFKLVRSFKPLLFGTSADEFRKEEWPRFLRSAARFLRIYVRIQPIYPDSTGKFPVLSCGSGLLRTREAGLEILELLDDAVRFHGSLQMIPFIDFTRVIDALEPGDLTGVRPLSMKRFIRTFVQRYLAGDTEGPLGRDAEGLTLVAIDRGRRAFLDWVDGQRFIEGLFSKSGSFDCLESASRGQRLSRYEIEQTSIEEAMRVDRAEDLDPRTVLALQKFRSVLVKRLPLYSASGAFMEVDPSKPPASGLNYNDLFQIHWVTLAFSLGQQAYREKRFDSVRERYGDPEGLVVEELQTFYQDLREIGKDLKFVDPDRPQAPRLRFRDGNLFMPASDGDMKLLSVGEAIELAGVMVSAKMSGSTLYAAMTEKCKSIPGGTFGTKLIEKACFLDQFERRLGEFLGNFPSFVEWTLKRSRGRCQSTMSIVEESDGVASASLRCDPVLEALLAVAMQESKTPAYVDVNDLDALVTVVHYIELLFFQFDDDRSGAFETSEALKIFERFEPVLRQMAQGKLGDRETLRAAFTYLATRGKLPETTSEKLGFFLWKLRGPSNWKLSVDRFMIVKIFAQLSASSSGGDTGLMQLLREPR